MSAVSISDIVELVGGRYDGPGDRSIRGVAALADAADDQLSFLSNPKYTAQVATTGAGAILVALGSSDGSTGSTPLGILLILGSALGWAMDLRDVPQSAKQP